MKKTLVALAALAVAGVASAQSSVTLFGVADANLAIGNGSVSNRTALGNSGISSSRLGFRGTEDLGGGMKANFWLEAGVNNDSGAFSATNTNNQAAPAALGNGQQGLTFNRSSWVGVSGGWGEVRLGRDYTPAFRVLAGYDAFGTNGVGTNVQFLSSIGTSAVGVRASNGIEYLSPNFSGFTFGFMTFFGENPSNNVVGDAGNGNSLSLQYANGPIGVGLGWGKVNTGLNADVANLYLGGSYDFGVARLLANWSRDTGNVAGVTTDQNGWTLGVTVPMGGGEVRAAFSRSEIANLAGSEVGQFSLGYVHNLSKRTALYGTVSSVTNGTVRNMSLNGSVTAAGSGSTGIDLGLRHSF